MGFIFEGEIKIRRVIIIEPDKNMEDCLHKVGFPRTVIPYDGKWDIGGVQLNGSLNQIFIAININVFELHWVLCRSLFDNDVGLHSSSSGTSFFSSASISAMVGKLAFKSSSRESVICFSHSATPMGLV